ncbi:hypothetical protein P13BB106kb_p113 [Pectobacterium phage DU_PP_V]|uniref:Tape measure chaperone n=1 Tax=Pectobacterium phage DU_PP_V TaxID=2041492 RepID=A0A2D2W722_9CAUD|nr:tail assembly chaperone [Pectobacterium phage DU_PP_V]ATS94097.1 hypothetical protein P13BB106kb_p113 [Pectobacterium phage DU_PP_V]
MTREQYLTLCESLGQAPDPALLPAELEDFPEIVRVGITIYNNLLDQYVPGDLPAYIGKDKSSLPVLFEIYAITELVEKEFILNIINIFDTKAVQASKKRIEQLGKKSKTKPTTKPHSRPGGK